MSFKAKIKFYRQQKLLESFGYKIVNPLERMSSGDSKTEIEKKKLISLQKLISSSAVFIMDDVSLKRGENLEVNISVDCGLVILHNLIGNMSS